MHTFTVVATVAATVAATVVSAIIVSIVFIMRLNISYYTIMANIVITIV